VKYRYLCNKQDIKKLNHLYNCDICIPDGILSWYQYIYVLIFVEDNKTIYNYCERDCNICNVHCSSRVETLSNINFLLRDEKLKRILE